MQSKGFSLQYNPFETRWKLQVWVDSWGLGAEGEVYSSKKET